MEEAGPRGQYVGVSGDQPWILFLELDADPMTPQRRTQPGSRVPGELPCGAAGGGTLAAQITPQPPWSHPPQGAPSLPTRPAPPVCLCPAPSSGLCPPGSHLAPSLRVPKRVSVSVLELPLCPSPPAAGSAGRSTAQCCPRRAGEIPRVPPGPPAALPPRGVQGRQRHQPGACPWPSRSARPLLEVTAFEVRAWGGAAVERVEGAGDGVAVAAQCRLTVRPFLADL